VRDPELDASVRRAALELIGGLALSTPITLYVVPTLLVAIRGRDYQLEGTEG
jgi:multidrug efflux pump subunit AcrB